MKINLKKNIFSTVIPIIVATSILSCSKFDYRNAVPKDCDMLVSANLSRLTSAESLFAYSIFGNADTTEFAGIDTKSNVFLFETSYGSLGLCAKVSDRDDLEQSFRKAVRHGKISNMMEWRGVSFCVIDNSWVAGFDDNTFVTLGPVTLDRISMARNSIAKMLKQGKDDGITVSPLYKKIESLPSSVSFAALMRALPERYGGIITLGVATDERLADVILAAKITNDKGLLTVDADLYSDNQDTQKEIDETKNAFRHIQGDFFYSMSGGDMMAVCMNMRGRDLLSTFANDKGLQTMLMALNTESDIKKTANTFDGDMAVVVGKGTNGRKTIDLYAKTANNNVFHGSTTKKTSGKTPSHDPIDEKILSFMKNARMALFINIQSDTNDETVAFTKLMPPFFGKVDKIAYRIK